MSKKQKEKAEKKTTILVNNKNYILEDMTDNQKALVNHISDLDRKINSSRFNLDQMVFGKDAFVNSLTTSLESEAA